MVHGFSKIFSFSSTNLALVLHVGLLLLYVPLLEHVTATPAMVQAIHVTNPVGLKIEAMTITAESNGKFKILTNGISLLSTIKLGVRNGL